MIRIAARRLLALSLSLVVLLQPVLAFPDAFGLIAHAQQIEKDGFVLDGIDKNRWLPDGRYYNPSYPTDVTPTTPITGGARIRQTESKVLNGRRYERGEISGKIEYRTTISQSKKYDQDGFGSYNSDEHPQTYPNPSSAEYELDWRSERASHYDDPVYQPNSDILIFNVSGWATATYELSQTEKMLRDIAPNATRYDQMVRENMLPPTGEEMFTKTKAPSLNESTFVKVYDDQNQARNSMGTGFLQTFEERKSRRFSNVSYEQWSSNITRNSGAESTVSDLQKLYAIPSDGEWIKPKRPFKNIESREFYERKSGLINAALKKQVKRVQALAMASADVNLLDDLNKEAKSRYKDAKWVKKGSRYELIHTKTGSAITSIQDTVFKGHIRENIKKTYIKLWTNTVLQLDVKNKKANNNIKKIEDGRDLKKQFVGKDSRASFKETQRAPKYFPDGNRLALLQKNQWSQVAGGRLENNNVNVNLAPAIDSSQQIGTNFKENTPIRSRGSRPRLPQSEAVSGIEKTGSSSVSVSNSYSSGQIRSSLNNRQSQGKAFKFYAIERNAANVGGVSRPALSFEKKGYVKEKPEGLVARLAYRNGLMSLAAIADIAYKTTTASLSEVGAVARNTARTVTNAALNDASVKFAKKNIGRSNVAAKAGVLIVDEALRWANESLGASEIKSNGTSYFASHSAAAEAGFGSGTDTDPYISKEFFKQIYKSLSSHFEDWTRYQKVLSASKINLSAFTKKELEKGKALFFRLPKRVQETRMKASVYYVDGPDGKLIKKYNQTWLKMTMRDWMALQFKKAFVAFKEAEQVVRIRNALSFHAYKLRKINGYYTDPYLKRLQGLSENYFPALPSDDVPNSDISQNDKDYLNKLDSRVGRTVQLVGALPDAFGKAENNWTTATYPYIQINTGSFAVPAKENNDNGERVSPNPHVGPKTQPAIPDPPEEPEDEEPEEEKPEEEKKEPEELTPGVTNPQKPLFLPNKSLNGGEAKVGKILLKALAGAHVGPIDVYKINGRLVLDLKHPASGYANINSLVSRVSRALDLPAEFIVVKDGQGQVYGLPPSEDGDTEGAPPDADLETRAEDGEAEGQPAADTDGKKDKEKDGEEDDDKDKKPPIATGGAGDGKGQDETDQKQAQNTGRGTDANWVKDHNTKPTLASQGKGISGGHNEKAFRDFLKENGGEVVKEVKDPRYPGITHIIYKMPKLDTARNPIPGQFRDKYLDKTVYDPSKYSDDYVAKLSAEAGKRAKFPKGEAPNEIPTQTDVAIDGFVMRVYRDKLTKEIGNAHFKIGVDK